MFRELFEAKNKMYYIVSIGLGKNAEFIAANGEVSQFKELEKIKKHPEKYEHYLFQTLKAAEDHAEDVGNAYVDEIIVSSEIQSTAETW